MNSSISGPQVTRAHLTLWGFLRMPDVWLLCPSEGRHKYFERWYHAGWNYTAVIAWPGKDPLGLTQEDFLASVQAHMLGDEELIEFDPAEDFYRAV